VLVDFFRDSAVNFIFEVEDKKKVERNSPVVSHLFKKHSLEESQADTEATSRLTSTSE